MIPVDQTDTSHTTGNCLQAAWASLMECGLDEVPHFAAMEEWFSPQFEWVKEHTGNREYLKYRKHAQFPVYDELQTEEDQARTHVILCGPSPRGEHWHAVVVDARTGELAHDPHPTDKRGVRDHPDAFTLAVYTQPEHWKEATR